MDMLLVLMGLCVLVHSSVCSPYDRGCEMWTKEGPNVCCQHCHAGHYMVKKCGPNPKDLCLPCGSGMYIANPKDDRCERCTQCIGAQVQLEPCTTSKNTVCGCKEGLLCGNHECSFCIDKCGKGQEPVAVDRSCRSCPDGTYNDQVHQKCKPWSKRCPYPNQVIENQGDAFSDIKCVNITVIPVVKPESKDLSPVEWTGPTTLIMVFGIAFTFLVIIIILVGLMHVKQKKPEKKQTPMKKTTIISNPTDEPRTLIAIECSFHEAEQEQGNSSESLLP